MMSVDDLLSVVDNSSLAAAIRGDTGLETLFPHIETLHVLALGVVFGSILMVDLRLLGLTSRNVAVTRLSSEVLPYTWTAFLFAAITGSLMFISRAPIYVHNVLFQLKFLCVALAGLNMLVFHFGAYRHVLEWDRSERPPLAARVAGTLSILLWLSVIVFGRWTGFTTD